MPLVPGTLPPSSCFGTPQELLDLFAQYLEIAGNISDVRYANTSEGIPVNDTIWVDTSLTPPRLKIYSLGEWREIVVGTNTVGTYEGLFVRRASAGSVYATARKLALFDSSDLGIIRTLSPKLCNIGNVGVINGLDFGAAAANTWYCLWAIHDGSSGSAELLLSTNFATPSLPTGYGFKRRIGCVRNDGAGDFIYFNQTQDRVSTINLPIYNGAVGSVPSSYAQISNALIYPLVPPIATVIYGQMGSTGNTAVGSGFSMSIAAQAFGVGEQTLKLNLSIGGGGTSSNYSIRTSYELGLDYDGSYDRSIYWKGDADTDKYLSVNGFSLDL